MRSSLSIPLPRTLIVADDLTGACDAAVTFAGHGAPTRVLLDPEAIAGQTAAVVAISTGTRDVAPERAVQQLRALAASRALAEFPCLFKKVDSVFRGNTAVEVAAALELFQPELAVIAPGYTAQGRVTKDGVIHIHDLDGRREVAALEALRAAGVTPAMIPAGFGVEALGAQMIASVEGGTRVVFCDSATESCLSNVVKAAGGLGLRVLWIGSAGLAEAVAGFHAADARTQASSAAERDGVVLLFVGSDHPVSLRQIEHLRAKMDVAAWRPEEARPQTAAAGFLIAIENGRTREAEVAELTAQVNPHEVSALFMTGGDTAAMVCRAMDITALELERQFAPGIPQGRARGGRFDGATILLKSGGFGDAATMSRIVERFAPRSVATMER